MGQYGYVSFLLRRQIRTRPMHHFRRHANAPTQHGVRVNRLADVYGHLHPF